MRAFIARWLLAATRPSESVTALLQGTLSLRFGPARYSARVSYRASGAAGGAGFQSVFFDQRANLVIAHTQ